MNRLQKYYNHIILYDLLFKDHYINSMELPQMCNITLNTGIGLKAILDKKQILTALLSMELVSGQRPIITRAKKSIDKFKVRENMPIGCKVTLRKNKLYEMLDRFINIVIPYMDDSNSLFNHSYFASRVFKQKALDKSLMVENLYIPSLWAARTPIELVQKQALNVSIDGVSDEMLLLPLPPLLKFSQAYWSLCPQNLREKI